MQDYKLLIQTTTGGLQWEYPFTIANDAMAVDYGRRHMLSFQHVPWFMALLIVRADNSEVLGRFTLSEPKVLTS